MSQELTKDLNGSRSFEERVFARFDAIEVSLRSLDERVQSLDQRVQGLDGRVQSLDGRVQVLESRAYDTKPIWEHALTEILDLKREFREFKRDVGKRLDRVEAIQHDNRADIREAEERVERLESRLA
jgi:chromosome segregation ATPase